MGFVLRQPAGWLSESRHELRGFHGREGGVSSPARSCSICVRQGLYQTGSALARAGVVSGHDMTPEAALTKLYCLLASGLDPATVRTQMEQDLAGELTPPSRP